MDWTDCLFITLFLFSKFSDLNFSLFLNFLSNELWAEGSAALFILLFFHFSSISLINFFRSLIICS